MKTTLPAVIPPPPPPPYPSPIEILDACGEDRMLDLIEDFDTRYTKLELADWLNVSRRTLSRWIEREVGRPQRFAAAWVNSAEACALAAVRVVQELRHDATKAEIARARELAHGYRWEAKMRDRHRYGDQVDMTVRQPITEIPSDSLTNELAQLLRKGSAMRVARLASTIDPPDPTATRH